MKIRRLLSFAAALLITSSLAVSAYAADDCELIAPIELEGKTKIVITSSVCTGVEDAVLTDALDGLTSTYITVNFDEDGDKIFSIYTATRVPEPVSAFAAMIGGVSGTTVKVSAYATNDSLLLDWVQLDLANPPAEEDGYFVFDVLDKPEKYSFYRIDLELMFGDEFTLVEFAMFDDITDEPEYMYVFDPDGIDAGELPELVPVPEEEVLEDDFEYGLAFGRRVVWNR